MIKQAVMVSVLTLAGTALPAQAALLATWDAAVSISGSITDPLTAIVSGGGFGGTATLDSNGTFSLIGLDSVAMIIDAGLLVGSAALDLAASSEVVGSYDPLTQQLSGNIATVMLSENSPCSPSGFLGAQICGALAGVIDFNQPIILTASEGLADPITFDLVNDFSFLLGELGGVAELELSLSNVELSPVPVPAAVWLFGSALLGLAGVARRKSQRTPA